MFGRQNPPGSRPPGAIEFELTDVSDARRALDELPPGVQEVQQLDPHYWERRRRKPLPSDRALTGAGMDWLISLPQSVRPRELSERFPRIVNMIAEAWADRAAAERVLRGLLTDRRGNRRGFPPEIDEEIRKVAAYRFPGDR